MSATDLIPLEAKPTVIDYIFFELRMIEMLESQGYNKEQIEKVIRLLEQKPLSQVL